MSLERCLQRLVTVVLLLCMACKPSGGAKKEKGTLGSAHLSAIEKTCTNFGTNYATAIKNTPGAQEAVKASADKMQDALKTICTETLKKKVTAALAMAGSPTSPLESTGTQVEISTPQPTGKLGIVTVQKGTSQPSDQKDVLESAIKQALVPILKIFGLTDDKANSVAGDIASTLAWLMDDVGVSIAFSGNVAAGVMAGVSGALELMYYRPTGAGEIGFYCTPGMTIGAALGGFGGVQGSVDVGFTKGLGCKDTHSYEGGFVNFPIPLGPGSLTVSLGVDAAKFLDYMDYMYKAPWSQITTADKLKNEMTKFNENFVKIAQTSDQPLEILLVMIYIINISTALEANADIRKMVNDSSIDIGGFFLTDIEETIKGLARQIISLQVFKTPDSYSNTKQVFQNLLTKLVPESDYPFNRALISKFVDSLGGCDSIAFSESLTASDFEPATVLMLRSYVGYTYAINPQFQASTETYDRKKHIIMDLSSLGDFADKNKWDTMAATLSKNVTNTANQVANGAVTAANTVSQSFQDLGASMGIHLADGSGADASCTVMLTGNGNALTCVPNGKLGLAGAGDAITSYTGLDNFGPLAFLGNILNLADPTYLYSQCIKPGVDQASGIVTQIKTLFSSTPLAMTTQTVVQTSTTTATGTGAPKVQ